jgi:hypothetical protein
MLSNGSKITILVDENSLWLKHYSELFLVSGMVLLFIGQEKAPEYGSSDAKILEYCVQNQVWLFTENGKDFKRLLMEGNHLVRVKASRVKIIVSKQKYCPEPNEVLSRLLAYLADNSWENLTFVPLGKYSP